MQEAREPAPTTFPARPEEAAARAFLTPRVLDARAFEQYSATLQQLIREAAESGQGLRGVSEEVASLRAALREALKELERRTEAAAKVVPQLDQRIAQAEKAAVRAEKDESAERAARLSQLRAAGERLVSELLERARENFAAFEAERGRELREAAARVAGLNEGLLTELSQRAEKLRAGMEIAVADLSNRISGQARSVDERIELAREAQRAVEQAARDLEAEHAARAAQIRAHAEEIVGETAAHLRGLDAELSRKLQEASAAQRELDAAGAALEGRNAERLGAMRGRAEAIVAECIARAESRIGQLEGEACERVRRATAGQAAAGAPAADPALQASAEQTAMWLAQLLARAGEAVRVLDQMTARAEQAARSTGALVQQLESWKRFVEASERA